MAVKAKVLGDFTRGAFSGECADCHPRMKALVKAKSGGGPTWDIALT
jgi:hypothetical protein